MQKSPYQYALDLLTARSYSVKDLRRKLIQKSVEPSEADTVVARLQESGLLNDNKYALAYARSKLVNAKTSPRRIKQELARKGVATATIDEAIEHVVVDEDFDAREAIRNMAQKKLAILGDLPPLVLRRRLYGFLARRGYDLDDIQAVVQDLVS